MSHVQHTRFGTVGAATTGIVYLVSPGAHLSGTATNASDPTLVLPAWARHGTQPSYWTERWARKERLADWDRIAGTTFESDDVEDLIAHLHRAADAAQTD